MTSRANPLQFLKIGSTYININKVTFVEVDAEDETQRARVVFYFEGVGPEGWQSSCGFYGAQAQAIAQPLRDYLSIATDAEITLPDPDQTMVIGAAHIPGYAQQDDAPTEVPF